MDHKDQNMHAYSNIKHTVLFDNNLTVPTLFKNVIRNTVQLFVLFLFHMEITSVPNNKKWGHGEWKRIEIKKKTSKFVLLQG